MANHQQGYSNIVKARVKIVGTRPLLWNRFGPHAIPLEKQKRTGVAGHDPEEWRRSFLAVKDGQLYLDRSYIFGCLRDGAGYTKIGRRKASSFVAATLEVIEDRILVDRWMPDGYRDMATSDFPTDPDEPVYLDVRSTVNPSTRKRNIRYRIAASPGWKVEFGIQWDVTVVPRGVMEAIVIDSGRLVGLADGRSIGFGRFEVTRFEGESQCPRNANPPMCGP